MVDPRYCSRIIVECHGNFQLHHSNDLNPRGTRAVLEAEQMLIESTPLLSNIAFAIGVFGAHSAVWAFYS